MPKINYYLRYLPTRDSHISRYPIPVNRGSLITHVKFQLPSANATFLDVMAGFDMCSTLPVPYPYCFLSGWTVLLEHADLIIMIIIIYTHVLFTA